MPDLSRVCSCRCHEEHDAELVPFCTRCDNDYANYCSGWEVNPPAAAGQGRIILLPLGDPRVRSTTAERDAIVVLRGIAERAKVGPVVPEQPAVPGSSEPTENAQARLRARR